MARVTLLHDPVEVGRRPGGSMAWGTTPSSARLRPGEMSRGHTSRRRSPTFDSRFTDDLPERLISDRAYNADPLTA
jgi:hypothetical protein